MINSTFKVQQICLEMCLEMRLKHVKANKIGHNAVSDNSGGGSRKLGKLQYKILKQQQKLYISC